VVVVLAFVELEHRLARLEIAARQQPGLLELHQHPVHGGQADVGAFGQQALYTSSAVMWRRCVRWKTSRILMRGSVAFRPLLLSSSACVIAGLRGGQTGVAPLECADHIHGPMFDTQPATLVRLEQAHQARPPMLRRPASPLARFS
jgi:hypothetical protein